MFVLAKPPSYEVHPRSTAEMALVWEETYGMKPFLLTFSDRSEIAKYLRKTPGLASYGRIGHAYCLVSLKVWQSLGILY